MFVMKDVWAGSLAKNIMAADALNEAQYARKGQIAQMSVLNKRLNYDLQHVLREEAFQADNGTMNCYKRIIDNISVIVCMRMGLSERAGRFLKEQLTGFKHKILIGNQTSEKDFCNLMSK